MREAERRQSIEQAARRWVVYLHSGDIDPQVRRTFEAWLIADPAHARAYRDHEQLMGDLSLIDVRSDRTVGQPANDTGAPASSSRTPSLWRQAAPIAAALVFGIVCLAALGVWRPFGEGASLPAVETQIAEIRTVTLPDGSSVTLGARSKIQTRFTDGIRLVTLSEGEAFFDVTPDPSRPFYVDAGDRLIRVVGTRFDVRRGDQKIKISVVEGVVEVMRADNPVVAETTHSALAKEVLRAGDQVVTSIGADDVRWSAVEPEKAASWRRGWLTYENASLSEIVADANRYNLRQIELESDELKNIRITAAFGTDQIEQFVAGLEASQPISADKSNPDHIVLRARDP
ncbi:MAG: FecR domain-containing protein [Hyphomonadaceae bacterium]|nr:FecR domain-containing protein [Hyphomonadaceae bacterium]